MKKVVSFLIILILAGTAFFFGWAQLQVPPGSYGVIRSKTHGLDTAVIREGEFRWVWYKLIPTNAVTLVFTLNPVTRPISVSGTLPMASTYTAVTGLTADFSYAMGGTLSFTLKPGSLPALIRTKGLTGQDGLEEYERELGREIEFFALERLETNTAEGQFIGGSLKSEAKAHLEAEILRAFPDIENLSLAIHDAKLPDFALYAMTRSIYEEYLNRQRDLLKAELAVQAERNVNTIFRFDELEKYGELLTKYPVLLEYLALQKP